jgi:hypothetical protein
MVIMQKQGFWFDRMAIDSILKDLLRKMAEKFILTPKICIFR